MLIDKARQTIVKYNMLEKGDRVVVGVSGGPDSMALLYILNLLKKEFNLTLFVAHLNHMLRKTAASRDAMFVKRRAERLNLPAVMDSRDVLGLSKASKISIEEAGRDARHNFYLRAAERFNANKIALGHTQDDQAETVLMRLLRGSGLLGLSGIPPVRKFEDKKIIRPLIDAPKEEVIKFLSKRKIPFRRDITNIQPIYLRNRIRQRLLPFLENAFNPEIKKVLNGIAKNVRIDYSYLLKIAEKKFKRYATCSRDKVRVSLRFLDEDVAIQRMIIREAVRKIKGDLNSITYAHWEDLNGLLKKKAKWQLNLPDNVLAKGEKNGLIFCRKTARKKKDFKEIVYQLEIPGRTKIPEIDRVLEAGFVKKAVNFKSSASPASPTESAGRQGGKTKEFFDFEKLKLPLLVRFKKSGDRIMPLGMARYKRLKQLFIDEKIPLEKRDKLPLVVSQDKIIWICGVKRSNHAKIMAGTKKMLSLRIKKI